MYTRTFPVSGSSKAASRPKKGTVAEPGFVGIAPGKGVITIEPVSVCLRSRISYPDAVCIEAGKLPVGVDDAALLLSHKLVIPKPRARIDRFADGAQNTKRRQVVPFDVMRAQATKKTDSSGRAVEMGELMLCNSLPVAGRSGVNRSRFEDTNRNRNSDCAFQAIRTQQHT
jgi:hypothetical protein